MNANDKLMEPSKEQTLVMSDVSVENDDQKNIEKEQSEILDDEKDDTKETKMSLITFPEDVVVLRGKYAYASDGTLRNIVDKSQFQFTTQAEYEKLADDVLAYCQNLLESELVRRTDASNELDECPIWLSKDFAEKKKFLLLIQGSGRVRAGVWGCKLCINAVDGIGKGTMLGYIRRAHNLGYGVIVANPNENIKEFDPDTKPVYYKNSENGIKHCITVYETVIKPVLKKLPVVKENKEQLSGFLDILAHSNGGYCTMGLLKYLTDSDDNESLGRFRKIGLTDSAHDGRSATTHLLENQKYGEFFEDWFGNQNKVVNFVTSNKKFGTKVAYSSMEPIHCLSCEINDHASTNFASEEVLFDWLDDQVLSWSKYGPDVSRNEDIGYNIRNGGRTNFENNRFSQLINSNIKSEASKMSPIVKTKPTSFSELTPVDIKTYESAIKTSKSEIGIDWSQNDRLIKIRVNIQGVENRSEDIKVERATATTLKLEVKGHVEYSLKMELAHPTVEGFCVFAPHPTFVEIKMKKDKKKWSENDGEWESLCANSTPNSTMESS